MTAAKNTDLLPADDGLPARVSGPWAEDKLFFLERYMNIFSTGMKNAWPRRVYVDLMAGPGRCIVRNSARCFAGSPVRAGATKEPFADIVLVENNQRAADALEQRMRPSGRAFTLIRKDCNDPAVVATIRRHIGAGLALVFVDLIGLDVRFDTIRRLTANQAVDLVVTFPDMGLTRNAPQPDPASWTAFFGGEAWRDPVARWWVHGGRAVSVAGLLAQEYRRELSRQLGYDYSTCARPMVNGRRASLYRPLFASRNPKGLEFWLKISRRNRAGQQELFGADF